MTSDEETNIRHLVQAALEAFLKEDKALLEVAVSERTITSAFAKQLDPFFPEWKVDPEYNRDGHEVKRANGVIVVPDIIVHKRQTDENLLIIEAKKSDTREPDDADIGKLQEMKAALGYRYALFVKFKVGPTPGLERVEWV